MLGNHGTFAYTGLTRCSITEPTDQLLLRSLAEPGVPILGQLHNLGKTAAQSIRSLPLPSVSPSDRRKVRRTSFVGAGFLGIRNPTRFTRMPSEDNLHPFLAVVSNAQGLTEEWRAEADQVFNVGLKLLEQDEPIGLHAAGQSFNGKERVSLERDLRRCIDRVSQPESVARLLARAIRNVALHNPRVGPNVMCTMVRRARVLEPPGNFTSGAIPVKNTSGLPAEVDYFRRMKDSHAQYIYSPGDPSALLYYGPNWASNGLMVQGILFGPSEIVNNTVQNLGRARRLRPQ